MFRKRKLSIAKYYLNLGRTLYLTLPVELVSHLVIELSLLQDCVSLSWMASQLLHTKRVNSNIFLFRYHNNTSVVDFHGTIVQEHDLPSQQ